MDRELQLIFILDNLQYISVKAMERGMTDIAKDIANTKFILEQIYEDEINTIKESWIEEINKIL